MITISQPERRPMLFQRTVNIRLMKTDLTRAPAILPKLGFHGLCVSGRIGVRRVVDRLAGNLVLLAKPSAKIDKTAALTAERPILRGRRPLDRSAASGAFDGAHHAVDLTRSMSAETVHRLRRARGDSWHPANSRNEWCTYVGWHSSPGTSRFRRAM